jgi:MYXO-CTERM domain-containing protein
VSRAQIQRHDQSAPVTITVTGAADAGASTSDAGRDAASDATAVDTGTPDTGTGKVDSCGCHTGSQPVSGSGFALLAFGAAALFRGRRKARCSEMATIVSFLDRATSPEARFDKNDVNPSSMRGPCFSL